jgi:hypothetical protein
MRTLKQIEAARRNGAKSRGPVTAEGKARSSRNAVTHGLNSRDIVLSTEDAPAFEQLRNEYWDHYAPSTRPECDLVNDIVAARWRLDRLLSMETAAMENAMDQMRNYVDERHPAIEDASRTSMAFTRLANANNGAVLNQFARYESRHRRTIERAVAELRRLRKEKQQNEPEPQAEPLPAIMQNEPDDHGKPTLVRRKPSSPVREIPRQPQHRPDPAEPETETPIQSQIEP